MSVTPDGESTFVVGRKFFPLPGLFFVFLKNKVQASLMLSVFEKVCGGKGGFFL